MPCLLVEGRTVKCGLVIFDKNGTLVDQNMVLLALAKARRSSFKNHAGEDSAALWERLVGVNLKNDEIDQGGPLGTAPRREEILIASAALYLNQHSWSEAKQLAQKIYDEADESMTPPYGSVFLSGVEEALSRLKRGGLKLAIASTDTHRRTVESFKALGVAKLFDVVVGSDDVVNGKPSPDMILQILKETGVSADDAVMVGDSASDMQMGRNVKVQACIGVLTGFTSAEKLGQLADIVVSSVAELRTA